MLLQYSPTARLFDTRIHTYENLTRSWRANIYVYRGAAETTLVWSTVRVFLRDEDRRVREGTITLFYIYHHLPLKLIHNKVRILIRGGRECLYTSLFIFYTSSVFSHTPSFYNFLPAARDKLRSIVSLFCFFPPLTDPRFGVFWTMRNTFPSVREICSSNGCIRDESFCSLPKPKSQLTYHSNSHP